jgi:hypothetical protein
LPPGPKRAAVPEALSMARDKSTMPSISHRPAERATSGEALHVHCRGAIGERPPGGQCVAFSGRLDRARFSSDHSLRARVSGCRLLLDVPPRRLSALHPPPVSGSSCCMGAILSTVSSRPVVLGLLVTIGVRNINTECRSAADVHATWHGSIVWKRRGMAAPHHPARRFSDSDKNRYR